MKIQLRAALEVVVGTFGLVCVAVLANSGLEYILENYGAMGLLVGVGIVVMLLFMNIVYQIRVSQLKYLETLNMKVDQ